MRRALVTGANRGLGLEFVRQLIARGDRVFAACRNPDAATDLRALAAENDRLTVVPLEITDDASIAAMRQMVGQHVDALDLLINNAGIGSARSPHRAALADLGTLERARMVEMLEVNAVSPILVTQALRDLLIASGGAKVLVVSSNIGSLGLKAEGGRHASGRYAYGASKAALNYMTIGLANDMAKDGVIAVAAHPGYVRTDMGGPDATEAVDESAARLLAIIDRATAADSGAFFNFTGERLPY